MRITGIRQRRNKRDLHQLLELQILLYPGFVFSFSHLTHCSSQEIRMKFLQ